MSTLPVAFVGFGHSPWTKHLDILIELENCVGHERFVVVDLREFLNDPHNMLKTLRSQGDGFNFHTQVAVLSQPAIVVAVQHCFRRLIEKFLELAELHTKTGLGLSGVILAIGCDSGSRRADVLRLAMGELLNSVHYDGERVFNAMDFTLLYGRSLEERRGQADMIETWINRPWKMQKSVSMQDSWCKANVCKDCAAYTNFQKIWSWAASVEKYHEADLIDVFKVFDPPRYAVISNKRCAALLKVLMPHPHQQPPLTEEQLVKREQAAANSSREKHADEAPIGAAPDQTKKHVPSWYGTHVTL